jgi:pimeloyl-ACP methyl ester carboxylesterase
MPYLQVESGVELFYQDRGQRDGPTIVFLHGWGASGAVWDYQVLDLSDRCRCITIDLRGNGASDSPWSKYDYDEYCRDLRTLLSGLDLQDVTLVGWSMGGAIALKYVRDVRERVGRLVLVGATAPRLTQDLDMPFGMPPEQALGLPEAERTNSPDFRRAIYEGSFRDLPKWKNTAEHFYWISMRMPVHVGYKSLKALLGEDLREGLETIDIPVYSFHGLHDQTADVRWIEWVMARIPSSKFVAFKESGHACMVEEREKFTQQLALVVGVYETSSDRQHSKDAVEQEDARLGAYRGGARDANGL